MATIGENIYNRRIEKFCDRQLLLQQVQDWPASLLLDSLMRTASELT
jgi:hypothetical protein